MRVNRERSVHNPLILNSLTISRKFLTFFAPLIFIVIGPTQSQPNAETTPGDHPTEKGRLARPPFNARRALGLIRTQLSFGSRSIGRPGHESAKAFLERELRLHADRVVLQNFRWRDFNLTNYIGWICAEDLSTRDPPAASPGLEGPCPSHMGKRSTVLLAAHWDTHPYASRDPDPSRRRLPVPGANDGGSGTAILLELARGMRRVRPPRNVLIVLFDGEDYGLGEEWIIGSKHFARTWIRDGKNPRPDFGILLDMVGDRDLNIHVEGLSAQRAPGVVEKILAAAKRVGARSFHPDTKHYVLDDHVPLNDAGFLRRTSSTLIILIGTPRGTPWTKSARAAWTKSPVS